ncbi:MAG: hypothetical protein Q3999_06605 [Buchananella hordeovulneris]|nr:hypothetical protein [Buchananella hordeovulneris]
MKLRALLAEAFASARSSVIPSLLIAIVAVLMCGVSLFTVGQQARLEAELARELQSPQARSTVVTALSQEARITLPALQTAARISGVTAIGLSFPRDVFNAKLGPSSNKVALVELHGEVQKAIELVEGRWPIAGKNEALISESSQALLRLMVPAGGVESPAGDQWSIVGRFKTLPPFDSLATQIVAIPAEKSDDDVLLRQLFMVPDKTSDAAAVFAAAIKLVPSNPSDIDLSPPAAAGSQTQQITNQVAGFGRQLVILISTVGGALIAVVVFADVMIRRRDLGRRRTLGITRANLVLLVSLRATFPALIGAALGVTAGVVIARAPLDFSMAVAGLSIVSTLVATLPPAAFAATRDPVLVMRTA